MMEAQVLTWEAGVSWVGRVCKKSKMYHCRQHRKHHQHCHQRQHEHTIDIKISNGVQETALYNSLVTVISLDIFPCPGEIEEARWLTMMVTIKK